MHISKIQLENIKSHVSSTYEFSRGTTAITGENGAGKTTIIEAIAWALFDLLEYKKDDFVRRGAKKGSVTVTFESGLDEREYIVYRDTGTGYYVIDPRLQTKVAVKKEEVFRFLWQHLGLEPGTDLRSLFKQAIGVPQGTFTAIFLEGAAERKAAFDRLLKVEEYRQAAEKLRDTSRFLDLRIASVRENIARSEGELSRFDTVEEEHKQYSETATKLAGESDEIDKELKASQKQVKELDDKEKKTAGLRTEFERLRSDKEKAEIISKQLDEAVERSTAARDRCEAAKPQYERHVEILGLLRELERERQLRDGLRSQLVEIESAIVNVKADQKQIDQDLKSVQKAHAEIEALKPKAADQEAVESEILDLRQKAAAANALDEQINSLVRRIEKLRGDYKTNQDRLTDAESKAAAAAELADLERRDVELTRSIAALNASLERDEKFQSEIKNGLCPILSERCLNLKEGQTLQAFVSSKFDELRMQIRTVEAEHLAIAGSLKTAREAAQYSVALDGYRKREQELKDEGQRLRQEEADLKTKKEALANAHDLLRSSEAKLKELADPKGRIALLETLVGREMELRRALL